MCEPATLAAIGLITTGVSTAGGVIGSIQEGQDAEFQAQKNKLLAQRAGADALARGNRESAVSKMQGSQAIGEQQVAFGASGVDGSVGTPAALAATTRAVSDLDADTIRANAAREAWGYKVQADQYSEEARVAASRGRSKAAGTLLGGAGQALSQYGSLMAARGVPGVKKPKGG